MSSNTSRWPGPPPILEEYRRIRLLGAGGMGQVYLYQDTELDRLVAVKFLHRLEPGFGQRFRTEALAAAKIQHPNVVTIHRVSEIDGRPYLVYEYIRGTSLEELPRPVPWRRAHAIGLDLARGLAAAHRRGVLHRDIKPGNAILDGETGEAKLIDFGLAKIVPPDSAPSSGMDASQSEGSGALPAPSEAREPAMADHAVAVDAAPAPGPVSDDVWGTLQYTAPEVLAGEAATQRSDIYALGVALHELCTGLLPEPAQLFGEGAPPMRHLSDVDAGFAAVIRRCLDADPARRYADGDDLRRALEALATPEKDGEIPAGNPYRGLLQFEAGHRALFFGRSTDARDVIDRLHAQHFVLLSGESGVGKSSLARAGVLPAIEEGALAQGRAWSTAIFEPGRWPLAALLQLLAARLGADEDALLADVQAGDLAAIAARMRRRHGDTSGTVLFIDQLEELVTWSDPGEAAATAELIAALAERVRGLRVLATARADQLARLAALPGLGQLLERNLVLVRPLGKDAIRETILGPARLTGVRFESDELVDELAESAAHAEGGLPLLQFALAELWKNRDAERNMITREAFDRLGGVAGALTQHADRVLAGWDRARLDAARRILLRLVTSHRTRARCTGAELLSGEPGRRDVLDRLVAGRLVVVSTSEGQAVYTLAHEALLRSWTTLRHWLDEGEGAKAVLERLGQAAGEWERTGRAEVALWRPTQLAEAQNLDQADLSEREAAFLVASRRAIRSKRRRQLTVMGALLGVAAIYGVVRTQATRDLANKVAHQVTEAASSLHEAEGLHEELRKDRADMEAALRGGPRIGAWEHVAAEELWKKILVRATDAAKAYQQASLKLDAAISLDHLGVEVGALTARVLDGQAHLANETGRAGDRDAFLARLAVYRRELRERWAEPVMVQVDTEPTGGLVTIERHPDEADDCPGPDSGSEIQDAEQVTPYVRSLPPGSYVFVVHEDERHPIVRYPFFLRCGQATVSPVSVVIEWPARDAVPPGFEFIPRGPFLFGHGTGEAHEALREWYETVPLHERKTGPYLIARHETTFAQWMEFLDACHQNKCPGIRPHLPAVKGEMSGGIDIELRASPGGDWELMVGWQGTTQRVRRGQPIVYPGREHRHEQHWEQLPVVGVSWLDAQEYLKWQRLRDRNRIPRARLCREDEWERAARGADDRLFPHGNTIEPNQANYDETYGGRALAFGPDAVGSYQASVSPFGLCDMAGNVWELVEPILDRGGRDAEQPPDDLGRVTNDSSLVVLRGGSYYQHPADSATVNRWLLTRNHRDGKVGFRVCADVVPPQDDD
jgi:serine/threonine protein kinase/formylglycine-generating enzyme required for sulfatase activity